MNNVVINPYEYFADPTKGRPIFNGFVYIGEPDTDPEVPANQKQVYARQEDGNEVAIAQPVRTNAGGYPTYNGSVVAIVVDGPHSLKVNNKDGSQLLYSSNNYNGVATTEDYGSVLLATDAQAIAGTPGVIPNAEQVRKNHVAQVATIDDLRDLEPAFDGQQAELLGHTVAGIGGGPFYHDPASVAADDNGITIVTAGGNRWVRKLEGFVTPQMFGGIPGPATSSTAIQAAFDTGINVFVKNGDSFSSDAPLSFSSDGQTLTLDGTITAIAVMPSIITSTDLNNIRITGSGTLDCNSLAGSGFRSFATAANPDGVSIDRVAIINAVGPADATKGAVYYVSTAGKASAFRHKNVKVHRVRISNCGDLGALVAYCDGVEITYNKFTTCGFHGAEAVNCTDIDINNNVADSCVQSGVGVGDECTEFDISDNIVKFCGGDASITVEQNCINGTVHKNKIKSGLTNGINVSFVSGAPGAAPFDRINNIQVTDNIIIMAAGAGKPTPSTAIGILAYNTGVFGDGLLVSGNQIEGADTGIDIRNWKNAQIKDNHVKSFQSAGPNKAPMLLVNVKESIVDGLDVQSDSLSETVQVTGTSERLTICNIWSFTVNLSAPKSVIKVDSGSAFIFYAINTATALHAVEMVTPGSTYHAGGITGSYTGALTSGGTKLTWQA